MGRLDGKVAVITGGARGQGAAEARRFTAEGARVVVADVLDNAGQEVVAEIGESAIYSHLDVTSEADWSATIDLAVASFGTVNVLVNNAGISRFAPLAMMTLEDYRAVVDVNQVGVFLGMRAAIPALVAAGGGSIINVSSVDGITGMVGVTAYVASKHAVCGMTKVAALELGGLGIRVNALLPGIIETPMLHPPELEGIDLTGLFPSMPIGRIGEAEEVADVALFLASDESSYCTGANFVVDGGITAGFGPPSNPPAL